MATAKVNTSSGAARTTSPLLAEYSGAKAYVEMQGPQWVLSRQARSPSRGIPLLKLLGAPSRALSPLFWGRVSLLK